MTIRKAFSKFLRTSLITNKIDTAAAAPGGTKITSGGFDYYVYTSPTTATFSAIGVSTQSRVIGGGSLGGSPFGNGDIFVVAGGGGGGGGDGMGEGGGGGAGGVRYFPNVTIPGTSISLQVGYGGTPVGSYSGTTSGDGQPSFFGDTTYISYGGGGGGSGDRPAPGAGSGRSKAGQGGSGGGAGSMGNPGPPSGPGPAILWAAEAGQGNVPPFSPPQGNSGRGGYQPGPTAQQALGGGGGAGGVGGTAFPAPTNAAGGAGSPNPVFPAPVLAPAIPVPVQPRWTPAVGPTGLFGGGGGGGRAPGPNPAAVSPGGPGGGGTGSAFPSDVGQPGADFTGGGAGGGYGGGQGGKGIIIIRKAV